MTLWMWLACTGEEVDYQDFTSRDTDITLEPTSEPSEETGVVDTGETGDISEVNPEITFRAPVMSCSDIQLRSMTLTRVFPDGLNIQGESDALFYEEMMRQDLSDASIEYSSTDGMDDCIFSLTLPTPDPSNLQEVILLEDGEEVEIGVQWAFYYPATFVHQEVDCSVLDLNESNTRKIGCDVLYSPGQTSAPASTDIDPSVLAGDVYDWGSNILPVYVQGSIEGAFGDLGFAPGWNLAQFSEGEMVLVEPISAVNQLAQIRIDNRATLSRYHINVKGSTSVETDFPEPYTIGLLPAGWLNGDNSMASGTSMYVQDSAITWSMEIWGRPDLTQFFGLQFPTESSFYQQWHSAVDVSAFVPLVFEGMPTEYQSGVAVLGDDVEANDARLGAVCKDSATLAFLFFAEPQKPSEIYWYNLRGIHPGWYAYYGTHGDANTWRAIVENTATTSLYNYTNLSLGPGCQVPGAWD